MDKAEPKLLMVILLRYTIVLLIAFSKPVQHMHKGPAVRGLASLRSSLLVSELHSRSSVPSASGRVLPF